MSDGHTLAEVRSRLAEVRDALDDVHMTTPASEIIARATRRRRCRGLAAAGAACAGLGLALALALPSGGQARPVHIHLAAWSVDTNRDGTVTVTVRQLTHAGELQRALAEAGVPAVVTFREVCLNTHNQDAMAKAGVQFKVSVHPPGEIITPSQIPSGAKLLFSIIPVVDGQGTRSVAFGWGLIRTGEPLHCIPAKLWHVLPGPGGH